MLNQSLNDKYVFENHFCEIVVIFGWVGVGAIGVGMRGWELG